jgi:5'-nucleotidase
VNRKFTYAALAMMAVAAGCQSSKTSSQALQPPAAAALPPPTAMDTTADAQASAPIDTSTPAAATPVMTSEFTPGTGTGAAYVPSTGGKYTVKAGDTLYHIALTHYGDGKQWKKIVAANPGLDSAHLRVGQKITLP